LYGPGGTVEVVVVGAGVFGFALGFALGVAVVAGATAVGTVGTVGTVGVAVVLVSAVTDGAAEESGAAAVVETSTDVDTDSLESGDALFVAASEHAASRATTTNPRTDRRRMVT